MQRRSRNLPPLVPDLAAVDPRLQVNGAGRMPYQVSISLLDAPKTVPSGDRRVRCCAVLPEALTFTRKCAGVQLLCLSCAQAVNAALHTDCTAPGPRTPVHAAAAERLTGASVW